MASYAVRRVAASAAPRCTAPSASHRRPQRSSANASVRARARGARVRASDGGDADAEGEIFKIFYHRPDGAYEGWGAHVWGEDALAPTAWATPLAPEATVDAESSTSSSWVSYDVRVRPGAKTISVLIHQGESQDCRAEEYDVRESKEAWLVSGYGGAFSSEPALDALPKGDIGKARALWVARDIIALPPDFAAGAFVSGDVSVRLARSASAALELTGDGVRGGDDTSGDDVVLVCDAANGLPDAVRQKFPHIAAAGYVPMRVPADKLYAMDALKCQLAVAATDCASGAPVDATGVQTQGAIDDLYAYDGPLGAEFHHDCDEVTLRVWAPTARDVCLSMYDVPRGDESTRMPMSYDAETGVWSATGNFINKYYNYEVTVFNPMTGQIGTNTASDPYARSLAADGRRAHVCDISNTALKPSEWETFLKPSFTHPVDSSIYELHVRDFSALDATMDASSRGKYRAFSQTSSTCVQHLRTLADAGLTHVHLLPSYDFGSVPELEENQRTVDFEVLAKMAPDSAEQQKLVREISWTDAFNWGYDPVHYGVPEGSYSTNPDGAQRVLEYREMVQALAHMGLRVVCDVVYNHTLSSGPSDVNSVLDKIVPGYYHRRNFDGIIEASTCCNNTASEHYMMDRLIVDDLVHWAKDYKVDGFRFDLMGHIMLSTMTRAKAALEALTLENDGVDGKSLYLYGEGWDYAEVAQGRVGKNASQLNLAHTGIGSFNDRVREGCIGGTPFGDPRMQGFITGLYYTPNGKVDQGDIDSQRYRMMEDGEKIIAALSGNVRDFVFVNRHGIEVPASSAAWPNSNVAYAGEPEETVNYVSAHDNETLFDCIMLRASDAVTLEDRCRMNHLATAIVALAQGVPFFHAGDEILRSKSLDRDSYSSGDWFNRLDYSGETHNFGIGLPGEQKNGDRYEFIAPMLADTSMRPSKGLIQAATKNFCELLSIRKSTPLLRLRSTREIQRRMKFYNRGPAQTPGLIIASINDGDASTPGLSMLDAQYRRVLLAFNATPNELTHKEADMGVDLAGVDVELHPLVGGVTKDATSMKSAVNDGELSIPAYTWAVFVQHR